MKRLLLLSLSLLVLVITSPTAHAAVLYESGTLGPTGVDYGDLGGTVPGTNVLDSVFPGVRFELTQHVLTSEIGGHFVGAQSGTFFGAIVELDDENDFPDSDDLTSSDVLGHTLLTFPIPSDEVFGNLVLSLEPGWYALVFGSGLFGATANGGAVRNGTDIGNPTYIAKATSEGWVHLDPFFDNHRFVILGDVVPEPTVCCLLVFGSLSFSLRRNRFQHR